MAKTIQRQPQPITVSEFLSDDSGLPEKLELVKGEIGPFSDAGIVTLIANWGLDRVIAATGPEVWREVLAAHNKT